MRKRLLVIGGVAAGPKAAAKAKRCDPTIEVVIYQDEGEISYAGCGLPYFISGIVKERDELISRTPGRFAQEGIKVLRNRRVEEIDIKNKTISGKNLESGEGFKDYFDRLVIATGAEPIRPRIEGVDLKNVFYLRSIFDADYILQT
ncbi:MAG: NAD(P)/FAD-dependent oxidoreductase, partial [Thermodesulfobacteriota bacterium]